MIRSRSFVCLLSEYVLSCWGGGFQAIGGSIIQNRSEVCRGFLDNIILDEFIDKAAFLVLCSMSRSPAQNFVRTYNRTNENRRYDPESLDWVFEVWRYRTESAIAEDLSETEILTGLIPGSTSGYYNLAGLQRSRKWIIFAWEQTHVPTSPAFSEFDFNRGPISVSSSIWHRLWPMCWLWYQTSQPLQYISDEHKICMYHHLALLRETQLIV